MVYLSKTKKSIRLFRWGIFPKLFSDSTQRPILRILITGALVFIFEMFGGGVLWIFKTENKNHYISIFFLHPPIFWLLFEKKVTFLDFLDQKQILF